MGGHSWCETLCCWILLFVHFAKSRSKISYNNLCHRFGSQAITVPIAIPSIHGSRSPITLNPILVYSFSPTALDSIPAHTRSSIALSKPHCANCRPTPLLWCSGSTPSQCRCHRIFLSAVSQWSFSSLLLAIRNRVAATGSAEGSGAIYAFIRSVILTRNLSSPD